MSRLRELLDAYRRERDRVASDHIRAPLFTRKAAEQHEPGFVVERVQLSLAAFQVCEYLESLDASDLHARDMSHPACPRVDAARRPHPMDAIDFE